MLHWLVKNGCPWNKTACLTEANESELLDIYMWISDDCPDDYQTYTLIADKIESEEDDSDEY